MSFYEKYPLDPLFLLSAEKLKNIRENFEVRDDDVIIASYPRSGTHWTAEIVSWILFHQDNELRLREESHPDRTPYLDFNTPECSMTLEALANSPREIPRIYMTHLSANLAPKQCETKGKVIYVMRNPKDTAVSYFHLYRITKVLGPYEGPWSEFIQAFMKGDLAWGECFEHVLSWWERRHDKNVLIVRYEEMLKNPHQAVRNIAEFLGRSLAEEDVQKIVLNTSFEVMKKNPLTNVSLSGAQYSFIFVDKETGVEFVRKGGVGGWKETFTVAENEQFDELIERKLHGSGIVHEYVE